MRFSLMLAVAIPAAAVALVACGGDDEAAGDGGGGTALSGAEVYMTYCASSSCHGSDGRSGSGGNLEERVPALTDEQITDIVLNGGGPNNRMLAAGTNEAETAAVIDYLRAEFPAGG